MRALDPRTRREVTLRDGGPAVAMAAAAVAVAQGVAAARQSSSRCWAVD